MISILPTEGPSSAPIPKVLHGYVSVRSQGGTSILDAAPADLASSAQGFHGTRDGFNQARKALESIGFLILAESRLGIAVAGPPEAYEELSGGKLETVERLMQGASNRTRYVTHVDIKGPNQPAALGVGITGPPRRASRRSCSSAPVFIMEPPLPRSLPTWVRSICACRTTWRSASMQSRRTMPACAAKGS